MRYERKYRIEELTVAEIRAQLDRHPAGFRKLFPDRQVNNVYLDTPALQFLGENLAGIAQRKKYRIRWYGSDLREARQPVLEVKIKDTELGEKIVVPLEDFRLDSVMALRQAVTAQMRHVTFAEELPVRDQAASATEASAVDTSRRPLIHLPLEPALINTYLRSYLISSDGKFRLTIDRDMRFYPTDYAFRPYEDFSEDEAVVVEVKYEETDDRLYDEIGQYLPFRLTKNSKYVHGMLLVGNA